jgi:hypothetical protein
MHTWKYMESMYPNVLLIEETKKEEKKERNIASNNEIHHICEVITHKKTC